ncbi:hypothetical protein CDD81_4395 [Ophiocordyceps australis]|uniref:ATP-dependent RNA helicase ROK1 n=1 Tax=Ophiocordyceps australis TaxID=1399860 RepID=A0A2C5YHP6_9HYPO|nr:hypothetical protein CDD81_4395 [Ophiocordyceps australis]
MDIFKVLSRGTKRTSRGTLVTNIPSAGTKTNPQLFHDQVAGQKRKRRGHETETETCPSLPEVDFFASIDESAAANETSSKPLAAERAPSPQPVPAKKLSEDECRQILKSHRLKITLMSKPVDVPSEANKKRKKKMAVGHDCSPGKKQVFPQPLESFAELRSTYQICRQVSDNVMAQGYRVPTEVQLGALPLLLRPEIALSGQEGLETGADVLVVAPTGSGKTISFLIPAIDAIMRKKAQAENEESHELEAIVVAPTRELAHQIVNQGRKLAQGTGIKVACMRKGMRLDARDEELLADSSEDDGSDGSSCESSSKGGHGSKATTKADILVTTPLHLVNFIRSGPAGTHRVLPSVSDLILDEADVLLDALFREETLAIWLACCKADLRVSCWSATMGSNIESLVTEQLASRAKGLGIRPKPLVRLVVGLKDTAVPNVVHKLMYTGSEQGKLLALRQLLHPTWSQDSGPRLRPPFIVFTQTIDRATALQQELKYDIPLEAGGQERIAALHSGLGDSARASIMRKFRAGQVWVLITTDVLARGIDFAGVNGVVNFDMPGSSAAYVHRAGRTGRAGREGGVAVTLYTKDDIAFVKTVANVIAASDRQAGKTGDEAGVQPWLLNALPKVAKADKKKLKQRGVEARRRGTKAKITSKSGYERRREHNRQGAIEGSKRRARQHEEWEGLAD